MKTDRGGATTGPESASILASRLIGQGVYDARGVEIGQISDVVLTDALGGMGAVIRLSSLMGLSSREVLIPRAALSMRRGSDGEARLTATWSKEQIESAPVFDRNALMR